MASFCSPRRLIFLCYSIPIVIPRIMPNLSTSTVYFVENIWRTCTSLKLQPEFANRVNFYPHPCSFFICDCLFCVLIFLSLFNLWGARAPKINTTEYYDLVKMGVPFDAGDGRSAKAQAGYQIAGLAVALGIAIIGGIVTGNENCFIS